MALLSQSLEDQIRARWGKYGDWNAAGQDQVAALANLLRQNGINDLSQLKLKARDYNIPGQTFDSNEAGTSTTTQGRSGTAFDVFNGDQQLGYLGDINRDGSYSAAPKERTAGLEDLGQLGDNGDLLGWSAQGGGNTSFKVVKGPDGEPVVVPVWGSSSKETFGDIKGAATVAAFALGANAAFGAGGAGGEAMSGMDLAADNPAMWDSIGGISADSSSYLAEDLTGGDALDLTHDGVDFSYGDGSQEPVSDFGSGGGGGGYNAGSGLQEPVSSLTTGGANPGNGSFLDSIGGAMKSVGITGGDVAKLVAGGVVAVNSSNNAQKALDAANQRQLDNNAFQLGLLDKKADIDLNKTKEQRDYEERMQREKWARMMPVDYSGYAVRAIPGLQQNQPPQVPAPQLDYVSGAPNYMRPPGLLNYRG